MAVASVISGTGSWTLVSASLLVSPVTFSVSDPPTKNPILASGTPVPDADFLLFPTVTMVYTLTADGTDTVNIIGDEFTQNPDPVDSIGFTANVEIDVVNDTGHDLSGLTLNLQNVEPSLPYNQGNSIVYYGEADYDANYAYFTHIQPVDGLTMALFTPTSAATTAAAAGPAPSEMVLTGNIAQGATVVSDSVIHNTELTSFNDFNLSVTDAPITVAPPPPPPPPVITQSSTIEVLTNSPNNVFDAAHGAANGDVFYLDGGESSMTVGLSSSTMWAFGYDDTITAQGNSNSTIYDRGTEMHVIIGANTSVSIDENAAGMSQDWGWTLSQTGVSAATLAASAHSDGHGGIMVGVNGSSADLMYAAYIRAGAITSG